MDESVFDGLNKRCVVSPDIYRDVGIEKIYFKKVNDDYKYDNGKIGQVVCENMFVGWPGFFPYGFWNYEDKTDTQQEEI
jgi:hypothetical protein